MPHLVGVNVVYEVFSQEEKRRTFEIDVIQRCLPVCCLIINFNCPWCLKDPLLTRQQKKMGFLCFVYDLVVKLNTLTSIERQERSRI